MKSAASTLAAALAAAVALTVLDAPEAEAQVMPFHTSTALPIPLAESGVRAFHQRTVLSTRFVDGDRARDGDETRITTDATPIMVPYGIRPRTHLMVGIPVVRKKLEGPGIVDRNLGAGDLSIRVKHELLENDPVAGNRRLAVFAGGTLPTGETRDGNEPLPPALRTGAGVPTLSGQLVYSHVEGRVGGHGAVGYTGRLGSHLGISPGDRLDYDLALGFRLFPSVFRSMDDLQVNAYLELNGELERPASDAADGQRLTDSGGHTLFLSPGLQLIPLKNLAAETSVQVPVARDRRGTQMAPTWSVAFGLRALFGFLEF